MTAVHTEGVLIARLMELVEAATDGAVVPDPADSGPDSIRRLGLGSLTMLGFLVAVEDEFGIEWDDELEESVLASFERMAAYIVAERSPA